VSDKDGKHAARIEQITRLLKQRNRIEAKKAISGLHPYDIGRIFFDLQTEDQHRFLDLLEPDEIAGMVEEAEPHQQRKVMLALGPKKAASVLEHMSRDDAADLLGGMERIEALALLRNMESLEADKVRALLHYPEDTAGGLMTDEFVTVRDRHTVSEAIAHLRKEALAAETIYYVYVLDDQDRLTGVVSLRDLLVSEPDEQIRSIMTDQVISVPADMDQEIVAHILGRYDLLAIPVVNEQQRLLGIITVDDVIDVLIEEAREDLQHLSAIGRGDDETLANPVRSAKKRIPWLVLLLLIGTFTANLLGLFEHTIDMMPVLTAFMPMIAGMTGNTATQSLALVIRNLSEEQLSKGSYRHVIRREGLTGFWIALVCSSLIILLVTVWKGQFELGLIIGVSLFFALILGTLVGTMVPILLDSLGMDPTVASGPLITTLNDVFSLVVYFGLATLFLNALA
jgi:magnesium transporter